MPKCDKYEPQLLPCNQPVVTNSLHLQSSYTPHLQEHQSEAYLESSQTSAVEAVGYFRGRAPPWMFDKILNATLSNNSLWFEEGLRRSFPPMGYTKESRTPAASKFSWFTLKTNNLKFWTDLASSFPWVAPEKKTMNSWNNPGDISLSCQGSQIRRPPPRLTSTSNRTKTTTIRLIIYIHSTRIKLHPLAHQTTDEKLPHQWGNTRKSWTNLPSSFSWLINTRKKKMKTRSPKVLISFSYTSNKKKNWPTR